MSPRSKRKKKHRSAFLSDEAAFFAEMSNMNVFKQNKDGEWVDDFVGVSPNQPYTGRGYTWSSTKTISKVCKHSNDLMYHNTKKKIRLYGASGWDAHTEDVDYAINLAGASGFKKLVPSQRPVVVTSGPDEFKTLNELVPTIVNKVPIYVDIAWADMSILPVGRDFWEALVGMFPKNCEILASCVGGHGRTGTFGAIFAGILEGWDGATAIDFIRDGYCAHAVETQQQEQYIKHILG